MKERILRFFYYKYHSYFEGFFVEDMMLGMPQLTSEPALLFLANGKEKIERWVLYWIQLIQNRIVTDKSEIQTKAGMILMLKIFLHLVKKQQKPRSQIKETKEEEKVDFGSRVDEAINKFRNPEQ